LASWRLIVRVSAPPRAHSPCGGGKRVPESLFVRTAQNRCQNASFTTMLRISLDSRAKRGGGTCPASHIKCEPERIAGSIAGRPTRERCDAHVRNCLSRVVYCGPGVDDA
jgi:hypothetical protein